MILRITIDTGNAAFADDNTDNEITRILHRVNERIINEGLTEELSLLDRNGNKVGMATYTER